jgi:hypothetical protein
MNRHFKPDITFTDRMRRAYDILSRAPLSYRINLQNGEIGWGMFLAERNDPRQYGIHSTSFAVQLLSASQNVRQLAETPYNRILPPRRHFT